MGFESAVWPNATMLLQIFWPSAFHGKHGKLVGWWLHDHVTDVLVVAGLEKNQGAKFLDACP